MRIAKEFKEKHLSIQEKNEKEKKSERQTLVGHEREDFQTLSGEKIAEESRVVRNSEIMSAFLARKQLLVLMYKDIYLNKLRP